MSRFCPPPFAYALGSGARRPPGDNPTPMASLVSDLLRASLDDLTAEARRLRARGTGTLVTYSPKVFIPLTKLCRDVCGYCTFARPPRRGERAYLTEHEVLEIARAGRAAGCTEALFTLGDRPEARYRAARDELAELGCDTTLEYLARCAGRVLEETGLLPHLNPGVMSREELAALRPVGASMGLMLETTAERLAARGGPHWASPDKVPGPAARDDRGWPVSLRSRSRAGSCRDRRDTGRADRGARRNARARRRVRAPAAR